MAGSTTETARPITASIPKMVAAGRGEHVSGDDGTNVVVKLSMAEAQEIVDEGFMVNRDPFRYNATYIAQVTIAQATVEEFLDALHEDINAYVTAFVDTFEDRFGLTPSVTY